MKNFILLSLMVFLPNVAFGNNRIHFQTDVHPKTLDPAESIDGYSQMIITNFVETLMATDQEGRLVHALAKSHEVSTDGLTYRFVIRPGARWSDGVPVAAEHLVNTIIHRLSQLKKDSDSKHLLLSIKGARDYVAGSANRNSVRAYQDKGDLVIELERALPSFVSAFTSVNSAPRRLDVPPPGSVGAPSNGRYVVTKNDLSQEILLEPNPFNSRKGQLPIQYHTIADAGEALKRFKNGELDVLSTFLPSDLPLLIEQGYSQTFPTTQVTYLAFNFTKPPFNDRDLRRAFAALINRDNIKSIQPDIYTPTRSYLAPAIGGHHEFEEIQFVKPAATLPPLSLTYMAGPIRGQIVKSIQSDVRRILNTSLELKGVEWPILSSAIESNAPPLYMLGSTPAYNDSLVMLDSFIFTPGYPSSEYADLLRQIREIPFGERRDALSLKAHKILIEEAIVIPLMQVKKRYIVSPRLRNFRVNPYGILRADEIGLSQ